MKSEAKSQATIDAWADLEARKSRIKSMQTTWANKDLVEHGALIAEAVRKSDSAKAPKLSDAQVLEIRTLLSQWVPVKEISIIMGVDVMTIHHIKAGKTYKHVKEST